MTATSSSLSAVTDPRPERTHRLAGALAALLFLPLATFAFTAQGANGGSNQPEQATSTSRQDSSAKSKLPSVTIQAAREHALRLKVDHFVTSVIVQPWGDALYRWTKPVCPLVAGLPKAYGEFILERVSKAANDAHAPLAGSVCKPNLYVVATDHPERLLKKWWARDREMYNYRDVGIEAVEHFIQSRRPIRVWYNTAWRCSGGIPFGPGMLPIFDSAGVPRCRGAIDTRLTRASTGSNITSAVVMVDLSQMKKVTIGQMADYVALVGLADVRPDSDPGSAPSILGLFGHGTHQQGLTRWDRALLYSLYDTTKWQKLEIPELELTMVRRIAP